MDGGGEAEVDLRRPWRPPRHLRGTRSSLPEMLGNGLTSQTPDQIHQWLRGNQTSSRRWVQISLTGARVYGRRWRRRGRPRLGAGSIGRRCAAGIGHGQLLWTKPSKSSRKARCENCIQFARGMIEQDGVDLPAPGGRTVASTDLRRGTSCKAVAAQRIGRGCVGDGSVVRKKRPRCWQAAAAPHGSSAIWNLWILWNLTAARVVARSVFSDSTSENHTPPGSPTPVSFHRFHGFHARSSEPLRALAQPDGHD
jgi:hypothetical protein